MTAIGMDTGEVDRLAAELRAVADDLRRWSSELDGATSAVRWEGREAGRFKREAWPRHRASLERIAAALVGFSESASRNAADQRRASGVDVPSGQGSASPGARVDRPGVSGLQTMDEWVTGPLGTLFSTAHEVKGIGPNWGGAVFTGIGTGVTAVTVVDDLSQKRYVDAGLETAFAGGDVAAARLKTTSPVGYLGGVALQTWVEVGREARNVDWSAEGLQQIRQASLGDWANGFGEALGAFPKKALKIFGW